MASFSNKKFKRSFIDTDNSDDDIEMCFPRFIVIESRETPITQLSPFIIEKVISSYLTPIYVKKLKNQTLLVEVTKKKHANFLLKMTRFHNTTIKTYPHKSLNVSIGIVRSKELSLCSLEEIKSELKNQGVMDVKRITIKKQENDIQLT